MSRVTTHAPLEGVEGSGGNETQNFCYDAQNRLTWASNNTAATPATGEHCGTATLQGQMGGPYLNRYVYTQLGQLWQGPLAGTGEQQQYLYCNSGQPHQLTHMSPLSASPTCGIPGTTAYTASYDDWGNMTTRTYQGQIGTMTFDALNRLTQWKAFASSKQEQYLYNVAGERVVRRSNDGTSTKLTVYAFGLEEHQYDVDGAGQLTNTSNSYYYLLGGKTVGILSGPTASTQTVKFLLTDTLGSVVASFANMSTGVQVLGNQLYDPYGNQRYKQGNIGTDKGYTGQYHDSLTGLHYYKARYYDPVIGRFISADTIEGNGKGMDPYAYVGGNPTTFTDPTGHVRMDGSDGLAYIPPHPEPDRISTNPTPSTNPKKLTPGTFTKDDTGGGSSGGGKGGTGGTSGSQDKKTGISLTQAAVYATGGAKSWFGWILANLYATHKNGPKVAASLFAVASPVFPMANDMAEFWAHVLHQKISNKGSFQANAGFAGLLKVGDVFLNLLTAAYATADLVHQFSQDTKDWVAIVADALAIAAVAAELLSKIPKLRGLGPLAPRLGMLAWALSMSSFGINRLKEISPPGSNKDNQDDQGSSGVGGLPPLPPLLPLGGFLQPGFQINGGTWGKSGPNGGGISPDIW